MNLTNRVIFSVRKSMFGFDETVTAIKTTAVAHGWQDSAALDLQEHDPATNPSEVTRITNLYFTQPDVVGSILLDEANTPIAALMPFGVSVYENSNGEVFISAINLRRLSQMYEGEVQEALRRIAADYAVILKEIAGPDESVKAAKRWGGGCCLGCGLGCATLSMVLGGMFALAVVAFLKIITRIMQNQE